MDRFDKYGIGILIGLIAPLLFGWAYVETFNLWYALKAFHFQAGSMLSKLLLVAAFPDMALLFLFYATDTWKLAKGVLIGSFPYLLLSIWASI